MYKLTNGNMVIDMLFKDGKRFVSIEAEEYKQWLLEGNTPEPEFTEEELLAKEVLEAKHLADTAKQLALDSITVTTTSGKVFDGREKDIPLMSGAINASAIMGLNEHPWKLHDNTVAVVFIAELKEALVLSMQAIGALKLS